MTEVLVWFLTPVSGSSHHEIMPWASWHARLMVVGWAVLLPVGVLVARFFKVMPQQDWPRELDNKQWWHLHRGLQYLGLALITLGIYMAWGNARGETLLAVWHARLGWVVVALGGLQVLAGWLRGSKGGPGDPSLSGDHYDMTPRRLKFESVHKPGGYLALVLSVVVIVFGLMVADAPRWMWLALAMWWIVLALAFYILQRRGWCIDTYQAIWGPDTNTLASRRPAVGWGVSRYTAAQWQQKFRPKALPSDKPNP